MSHPSDIELIQITDTHVEEEGLAQHWKVDTYDTCRRVLRAAIAAHPNLDFIVTTGDLVDKPTPRAYRRFASLFRGLSLPVYRISGNHDQRALVDRFLAGPPFNKAEQIDKNGWRLILLDSSGPDQHSGHLREEELARLRRALQDETVAHTLIFIHHHPIPIGSAWMDAMALDNPEAFRIIAEANAIRLKAVAFGHVHQEFRKTLNDVNYLGTPSTCVQFVPNSDQFTVSPLPPGYRWFKLRSNGCVETQVYYVD